jgi:hypothetical protein
MKFETQKKPLRIAINRLVSLSFPVSVVVKN